MVEVQFKYTHTVILYPHLLRALHPLAVHPHYLDGVSHAASSVCLVLRWMM